MFGVFVIVCLLLIAFHIVQKKFPEKLPKKLQTWEFLPKPVFNVLCKVDEENDESETNKVNSSQPRIGSSKVAPLQENFYSQAPNKSSDQVRVVNEANKIESDDENEMNL